MKKLNLGVLALALVAVSVPAFASAATYLYVDQQGTVKTVVANTAMEAMLTAPNIDENSGVMIMDSTDDQELIGDKVESV